MRPASAEEIERWDELIAANPDGGNSLQSKAWGDFKGRWGWQPRRYIYDLGGRAVAAQWLVRKVPLQGEIWYCPKGPGVTDPEDFLKVVKLTKAAGLRGVFARFESEVLHDELSQKRMSEAGLVRANRDPGSKSTIFIDLAPGSDKVLASFNQSARRNLRKAEAGGVEVKPVDPTPENLDVMFELMRETEARAHYGLRPKDYFRDYWSSQIAAGQAQLFLAKVKKEILAGEFVTFIGKRAWYKDGGSFDRKRELNASYQIQWGVMQWLMERGITNYDMVGSPNRNQIDQPNDRAGLYEFKRKFNPEITEFIGCYDLPLNNLKYKFWRRAGERVAGRLAMRRKEKFLY
jgi:serine/alanine adding enzyme